MSEEDALSMRDDEEGRKIHCVRGDVTHPHEGDPQFPKFIINCLSDSGSWGRGGLFTAISKISNLPQQNYESAKENQDLHLGDAHLIALNDKDRNDQAQLFVVNVVAQHADKNGHTSGIILEELEVALDKVSIVAKNLKASVHLPRIGAGLANFNWYSVERVIKKCLASRGIPTFVYYFQRRSSVANPVPNFKGGAPSNDADKNDIEKDKAGSENEEETSPEQELGASEFEKQAGSSKAESTALLSSSKSAKPKVINMDAEDHGSEDLFESLRICLYKIDSGDELKKLKRSIIVNGGVVTFNIPDKGTDIVVTRLKNLDSDLKDWQSEQSKSDGPRVISPQWIYDCIRSGSRVKAEKYQITN